MAMLLGVTSAVIITVVIISSLNFLLPVWLDITFPIIMEFCYGKEGYGLVSFGNIPGHFTAEN